MIEIKNICKEYKNQKSEAILVLENINFEIKDGEVLALLGHNGSGKSTLLKCLCGVLKPTSGTILIDGKDSFKKRKQLIKNMGVIFNQKSSFITDLSVSDNLKFFKAMYNLSEEQYQKNLIFLNSYLNIENLLEKPYRKLSFGERVKCEIISILLHEPMYVVLDEPTIGLDYTAKKGLYQLIDELKKRGVTIIITTHEVDYIEGVCDRAVILQKGKIVYCGNPHNVTEQLEKSKKAIIKIKEIRNQDLADIYINKSQKVSDVEFARLFKSDEEFEEILNEALVAFKIISITTEEVNVREVLEDVLAQGT